MKRKYRVMLAGGILLLLILLISAFYALHISNITYTGSTHYTDEELTARIFDKSYSRNLLYCFWNARYGEKKTIPFIETYDMELKGWNELEIRIYEKSVVGYVEYKGYRMYFDKDGIIVESSLEALENVIKIDGLKFGHMVLHQKLPVEDEEIFDIILRLTQILIKNEIPANEIRFDKKKGILVFIDQVEVLLGDKSFLDEKVAKLKNLLPDLEGLSGTLYMNEFTEDTKNFRLKQTDEQE